MRVPLSLTLILLLFFSAAFADEAHTVEYFYENYCESCSPETDFAEEFSLLTGLNLSQCRFTGYNCVKESGKTRLREAMAELGLDRCVLPLIVVDGVPYQGSGELANDLPATALQWKKTEESVIVYLYVPACESCARAVRALESLPESVTVRRGNFTFESRVTVEKIDASRSTELADALFSAYNVPDDQRITPIVFFADRYLSGADAIEQRLSDMVCLGWAVGGVTAENLPEKTDSSALSIWGTLSAGLVGGLNGCALSMLLLFLSIIMETRTHAVGLTVAFLSARFVCDLLIGLALLGLVQRFNPYWLRPLARWLMTGIGAILIALNVRDALHLILRRRGKMLNQLPTALRRRLHHLIGALTQKRYLFPAVVVLGFIVALGEFLCAGQMYLMRLLSALQSGNPRLTAHLFAYCAAFIAPSALLSAAVLGGRSQLEVSGFLAKHLSWVKLLTALMMTVLIIAAWIV